MKNLVLILALAVGSNALAADFACFVEATIETGGRDVTAVVFSNVTGDWSELSATLPDQSTLDPFSAHSEDGKLLKTASFSNECDNMYTVSFTAADFDALVAGKTKEIRGTISYDTSGDDEEQKTALVCRKLY